MFNIFILLIVERLYLYTKCSAKQPNTYRIKRYFSLKAIFNLSLLHRQLFLLYIIVPNNSPQIEINIIYLQLK